MLARPHLEHIKTLIHGALTVVEYIESGESVLVQASPENDCLVQVVSIAELLLDEYYRTIEGGTPFPSLPFHQPIHTIFIYLFSIDIY